jgi:hypothetical protein
LRYAAADSLRATAIIERFFRSLKEELIKQITVPLRAERANQVLARSFAWVADRRTA